VSVLLAFGVTTGPGSRCWSSAPGGSVAPVDGRAGALPPGAPVVVGPAGAGPDAAGDAVGQLVALVAGATGVAAGAGVEVGPGFTSARLAGAAGDRRDAVLAALRFLGAAGSSRLGDRYAVLVALFGLSATKRVGAAAETAIVEERWAALQLASAASDLLGPEQLERVLELRAPDGIDPFPRGAASTLAEHLARVLARYPGPRRLALVVSLWEDVCARLLHRQRMRRLPSTQARPARVRPIRARHRDGFDAAVLQQLDWQTDGRVTLATAARWQPPQWWAADELRYLLHDALAATALLRFARAVSDHGLEVAARERRPELVAADACLGAYELTAARRRGDTYHPPARPGCYVHDLLGPLRPGRRFTDRTEAFVAERTAAARKYGAVVLDAVTEFLGGLHGNPLHQCSDDCEPWQAPALRRWRAAAGFTRAPGGWEQPPLADAHPDAPRLPLAQRISADPTADPAELEEPHDLLWYADLADALAPFHGRDAATVRHEQAAPDLLRDPPAPEPDRPRADTVPLAAAGIAQLVALGASPPPRCRSWPELADRVRADAAVAAAGVGAFPVPPGMSTVDGRRVPGTVLTVELGRTPRQLADWSGYMGNCIGDEDYAGEAARGLCVLMALRGPDGRIAANLDIRRRTGGWQVNELLARFNDTLDPALEEPVRRRVDALAAPEPPAPDPAPLEPPPRTRGAAPRRSGLPPDLTRALTAEVEQALTAAPAAAARRTYAGLARGLARPGRSGDFEPDAAVVALKRLGPAEHVDLLRTALGAGPGAAALWRATRVRPLAAAVDRLDPGLRERDRLAALSAGGPLPRTLAALVRRPEIAPAHAMDVVARAVRAAMGELLGSDALARAVARRPSPELVCALVIATTCARPGAVGDTVRVVDAGTAAVPGFPATDLVDEHGPWQRALPAAAELGVPVGSFRRRVTERGLLAPAALLGRGGWVALWGRAHR
jgi:hypothetical protein